MFNFKEFVVKTVKDKVFNVDTFIKLFKNNLVYSAEYPASMEKDEYIFKFFTKNDIKFNKYHFSSPGEADCPQLGEYYSSYKGFPILITLISRDMKTFVKISTISKKLLSQFSYDYSQFVTQTKALT